ncbi:hypothetical protein ACQEU8_28390 [Streptomyces sp. CA-250714]|uniref:hypothetical protein n=1 Tax=Streptomyces sp. CA-250714 TaxID=3240060 RepID=UPI003D8AA547
MTATPRTSPVGAVGYAGSVALVPWALGALVIALSYAPESLGLLVSGEGGEGTAALVFPGALSLPWAVAFPVACLVTVLVLRWVRPTSSRPVAAAVDTAAYAVVLGVTTATGAVAQGVGQPVDHASLELSMAFFTLQFPACFVLSLVLSKPLLGMDRPVFD